MEEISRASASVGLSYGVHSNVCLNQLVILITTSNIYTHFHMTGLEPTTTWLMVNLDTSKSLLVYCNWSKSCKKAKFVLVGEAWKCSPEGKIFAKGLNYSLYT